MDQQYMEYLPAFKALADETRLEIINMVTQGELCACEILEAFDMSQSTLSYHMKLLTDSGLMFVRRDGKKMLYTINHEQFNWLAHFCEELSESSEPIQGKRREVGLICR